VKGTFNYADYFPESPRARRFGFVGTGVTVGDELDAWLKVARLAASTRLTYGRVIARYLRPWFGAVRLRDLTTPMIRARILEVRMHGEEEAEPVTLKTARNILTPLGAMLELAVADGKIPANPMANLYLEKFWPEDRITSDFEADPFTMEEMTAIFAACAGGQAGPEADYWRFAFGTGLRPSEQIELGWPRVDLVHMRVRVEVARVTGHEGPAVKGPKTRAGRRDVDLTAGAWEALQRQQARTRLAGGPVFLDPLRGAPWASEEVLRKRFAHVLKRAGVRYRNPYQTRHTFASVLLAGGWPELQVARWMGHASVGPLRRNYARWVEQGASPGSREAVAAFFSHVSPTMLKTVGFAI
jgi:integrase